MLRTLPRVFARLTCTRRLRVPVSTSRFLVLSNNCLTGERSLARRAWSVGSVATISPRCAPFSIPQMSLPRIRMITLAKRVATYLIGQCVGRLTEVHAQRGRYETFRVGAQWWASNLEQPPPLPRVSQH